MRTPSPVLVPLAAVFSLMMFLLCAIRPADAGQVITDNIRQWARQAVDEERSASFKPAANTVAVLYFHNNTRQPQLDFLQMGMAVMLITDLSKVKEIQVVERARLQALIQELKLGASGLVTGETAPRMGRLLGARYLVGGDLNGNGKDAVSIDSDLINVPDKGVLGRPTTSGPLDEILQMEKGILFDIIRLLRLELTESQKKELRKPFTRNIKALMYLVQGLQYSDRGAYDEAAVQYRRALKLDPGLQPARSAVGELENLGLISPLPPGNVLLNNVRDRVSVNRSPIPGQLTKRHQSEPASVLGPAGSSADVRVQW